MADNFDDSFRAEVKSEILATTLERSVQRKDLKAQRLYVCRQCILGSTAPLLLGVQKVWSYLVRRHTIASHPARIPVPFETLDSSFRDCGTIAL